VSYYSPHQEHIFTYTKEISRQKMYGDSTYKRANSVTI
jgi:hypothetical protein